MNKEISEIEVEHIAKIIFESMHEESWHKVRTFNIEGDLYRRAARTVLNSQEIKNIINRGSQ